MEIKIEDYLTQEDMKRIAEEEYRSAIRSVVVVDKERILSNAAYTVVQKLVDEHFNESLNEILVEKVVALINDLSAYNVFKSKDVFGKDESKGWTYMQQAIENNKHMIEAKVVELLEGMDISGLHYRLEDIMVGVIEKRLTGRSFTGEE